MVPPPIGDGDDVRHAEVGAHTADLDRLAGLAREPTDEHADVGRGAADVDDDAVVASGQVGRAAQ